MNLPLFSVQDDPGPDFNRLLTSSGVAPSPIDGALDPHDYRHGTTCVAIRFAGCQSWDGRRGCSWQGFPEAVRRARRRRQEDQREDGKGEPHERERRTPAQHQ